MSKFDMPKILFLAVCVFFLFKVPSLSAADTEVRTDLETLDGIMDESSAPDSPLPKVDPDSASRLDYITLQEDQIILLNRNLKNLIEDTEKLRQEKQAVEQELKKIRGQREIESTRLNAISEQRDSFQQQAESTLKQNKFYERKLEEYEEEMGQKEKEFELKSKDLEDLLALQEKEMSESLPSSPAWAGGSSLVSSQEAADVMTMVRQFNYEKERLKRDSARVHYNMGNDHFRKGDYAAAINEYRKTLTLTPNDAEAHFNLALVNGDFLRNYETALKHYRMYLFLNPKAEDAKFVKEKILEATLIGQSRINSPLENDKPLGPRW